MGRKRKGDPLGLAGTRLQFKHGAFYYRHRGSGKWERIGTDVAEAKRRAALYNSPGDTFGTVAYWLDLWLVDFAGLVAAGTRSQRTLDDYRESTVLLKAVFGKMYPEQLLPTHVDDYLKEGQRLGRAVRTNRERACLSSMMSWLIRKGRTTAKVNPCMRASGVQRNPETARERYVTDEEYLAVWQEAPPQIRLAMELQYRTLQRPEVDIVGWTTDNIQRKDGGRVLRFEQSKTRRMIDIGIEGRLAELLDQSLGNVTSILKKGESQPIIHTRRGGHYTYDGLMSILKRAQERVRAEHAKTGGPLARMPSFGLRDLKGKGATDMWIAGIPIERIQMLCGHKTKDVTEKYIKARWRETAAPNQLEVKAAKGSAA